MVYYYQLGGFENRRLDFRWADKGHFWDHNKLAGDVFTAAKGGVLQLALGIANTGASYLLIPERRVKDIARNCRLQYPNPETSLTARDFESISPIEFKSRDELSKKLGSLASSKNNNRRNAMPPMDRSKANKGYDSVAMDPDRRNDGLYRPLFEHGRVLYRLKQNILDETLIEVDRSSWLESFRMCSFIYNRWQSGSPTILDIGLAEGAPGRLDPPPAVRHLVVKRNKMLDAGKRDKFIYGTSEEVDEEGATRAVQDFFRKRDSEPILLLVCGRRDTLEVLGQCYGVDSTTWGNGLKDLLQPSSRTRSQHPVYIVDVKEMALKHLKVDEQQLKTVHLICTKLGLIPRGQVKTVSAGNDSRRIFDAWTTLVEGPAIDEERELREPPRHMVSPSANNDGDDPGSDFDPNDIEQQAPAVTVSTQAGPTGDDYFEDSDYGDDDE
ncbi:uncharacterized protein EV420DRAFT_1570846 [Desarmillaria tabescens]|uniref:Uncharacterized protein n=1 Tax=Armillaria tabescens TaxID=1929756 RepID=A0AA39MTF6_ARMTA|nr:uncharacterized protein EV420DRAFT_1570846 [Desarmillaria tabescens]KAK0446491.1 hypothetical protein EV420DRAFT_1570846 [Desarmillaria tabescens]